MPDPVRARTVAVLAAMVPELQPLVRALGLAPMALGDARAYRGARDTLDVVAAVTAMGTRAATDVTTRLLDAHAVDHAIVLGVCGSVDHRLAIGALVVPELVLDEATDTVLRPTAIGGQQPRGVLLTTDVLHTEPQHVARLAERGVVAVDMETAAIGAVCAARGVPWSVFRAVSDRAGDPAVDHHLVAMANADGSPNVLAVVRFVCAHPRRIPKLVQLGRGLRAAVRRSTDAALAALAHL